MLLTSLYFAQFLKIRRISSTNSCTDLQYWELRSCSFLFTFFRSMGCLIILQQLGTQVQRQWVHSMFKYFKPKISTLDFVHQTNSWRLEQYTLNRAAQYHKNIQRHHPQSLKLYVYCASRAVRDHPAGQVYNTDMQHVKSWHSELNIQPDIAPSSSFITKMQLTLVM